MARPNFVSLTPKDKQNLKAMIRTGEPVYQIAKRVAPQYNRSVSSFTVTLYNLAKQTRKIAEWTGPKRTRRAKKAYEAAPTTTKYAKVERFDDHIRIYF